MTVWNKVTGSGLFTEGFDPTQTYKKPTSGTTGSGIPYPTARLGTVVRGSEGTEWMLGELVLASATDLIPGQAYQFDQAYTVTLTTTALAIVGHQVGICMVFASQLAAGTYGVWLAIKGQVPVYAAATPATSGVGETTTTGGTLAFPSSATANTTAVAPSGALGNATTTTVVAAVGNLSATIVTTTVNSMAVIGANVAGTGIPANTCIGAVRLQQGGMAIDMVLNNSGHFLTASAATATGAAVTVTISGTIPVNLAGFASHTKVN